MYQACGDFINFDCSIRGINKIFNNIIINQNYPDINDTLGSLELAADIHKEVRRHLQKYLKPNIKLTEIAEIIESKTIELSNQQKSINKGIGFPVGLSINNCVAHYHPKTNEQTLLTKNDIIKIDFGTEVNGWIIDSAFTVCFDSKFNNLLEAVKDGTDTGIKHLGVDASIADYSESIQEVIESYEIVLDKKTYPIKAVQNLGGHNILRGIIHGGTYLPCVKTNTTARFKEGVYAIETFGSTGDNISFTLGESTLYRINPNYTNNILYEKFGTLPFCERYIYDINTANLIDVPKLINNNLIYSYPPLYVNNGYTAQYEHTIYLDEFKKIILSKNDDY
jgi:methionyl aminopeptidase